MSVAESNKNRIWTPEMREEMRRKNTGSGNPHWRGGMPKCAVRDKQLNNRGAKTCIKHRPPTASGEKHYAWKGGITPLRKKMELSREYKEWRTAVFERDNYTCQHCGAHSGNGEAVKLNAVHIKPFALHPELRLDINNGRTLCEPCHRKTPTYGGGIRTYANTLS